ncbi:MAG: hypothetical protein H0Z28_03480 [Archaeoglobus sp.]|nr:hypothetical protein [Archaeoglobus sp.]
MMFENLISVEDLVRNAISVVVASVIASVIGKLIDIWFKKGIRKSHRTVWINKLVINDKIEKIVSFWEKIERPFERKKSLFLSSYIILWGSYGILLLISLINVFGIFSALAIGFGATLFVYLHFNKLLKHSSLEDSKLEDLLSNFQDFFKELEKKIDHNLYLRYLIYGILILGITYSTALLYVFNTRYMIDVTDFFIRYWEMMLYLLLLFSFSILSIVKSHTLEKKYIEVLRGVLYHKCRQECPEITIFLKSRSEKITGEITDLFDEEAIKLENKTGEKFIVPWDAISLIKIVPKSKILSEKSEQGTDIS